MIATRSTDSPAGIRYQPDEAPPAALSFGLGLQLVVLTVVVPILFPTVVMRAAGAPEASVAWAVFVAVAISGVTTALQSVRVGRIGGGHVLVTGSSAAFIGVCITAVAEGGAAMLATLVVISALFQILLSARLALFRRILTPTVSGTVIMMAMDTEEMVRAQPMDAVVLIGGCDKTIPAQLMAAASADVPALVLPTGPMMTGHWRGERLGACTDCRRFWGMYRAGELDDAEIEDVNDRLAPTAGTCMVMGTASTMACMTEALGMMLPGARPSPPCTRTGSDSPSARGDGPSGSRPRTSARSGS